MAGLMTVHDLHPSPGDADDLYRIGTVASLTGIAVERLRAWERRYDFTPAHRDGTQYGSRRGATRSFRRHHTSEISSAIVYADAETLLAHAEGAPV